jgi:hypothetical protein
VCAQKAFYEKRNMDLVAESKRSAGKRDRNRRGTIHFGDLKRGAAEGDLPLMPAIDEGEDGLTPSEEEDFASEDEPPVIKQPRRSDGTHQSAAIECCQW